MILIFYSYYRIFHKSSDYLCDEIESEEMCWQREIAQFELFNFPPLCNHMRQLHLNLVKFAPHWINALILNLVKTGGCAGPFDHTGEGGHHPLFHGSCPKDPLWVGNPNILEPFILPRFFGLLDPSVCWGRIWLRDVACRAGNSVLWLGAQDSQFFWLPKCVNRNTSD